MSHYKDKYDKMSPEEFNTRLLETIGGRERAKMLMDDELIIVDKRIFEPAKERIRFPAIDTFVARESFVVGEHQGVRIAHVGKQFTRLFLGMTEYAVNGEDVRRLVLRKRSTSVRMMPNLGRRRYACLALAHVHRALGLFEQGERDYLFFAKCIHKTLWPIMADRSPDGWWIECPQFVRGKERFDAGRVVVAKYRE